MLFFRNHLGLTVGVSQSPVPSAFRLYPSSPNPFNPATVIGYDLPAAREVQIRVFDATGRLVRVLQKPSVAGAGHHAIRWSGRDERGRRVGAGVYYYRIEAGEWTATRPMVLVR